jgi:hypothetical protein
MVAKLEYDFGVRAKRAPGAVWAVGAGLLVILVLTSVWAAAQINGTPASVSSINFGGHNPAPGVPASVTSLGPNGLHGKNPFFTPPACCINPLFPTQSGRRHRHIRNPFFAGGVPVAVPVYTPVFVEQDAVEPEPPNPEDDDRGGPTIFDRRGPGTANRADFYPARPHPLIGSETEPAPAPEPAASQEAAVADQPQTVLVFKDGHQIEVQNYAVVGSQLYDFTPGHSRKISLADLDLKATAQQNDDRGIDFRLPAASETSEN